jgi:hypothetical protein
MFAIQSWLMIMSGLFYPLVFAMGCQQKKLPKILQPIKGKGDAKQLSSKFKDTSNYFSLPNLKSLIERFVSLRNLWEGEWKKLIKYHKAEMNTICDTKTFMYGVLNNLLCMHCLDNFMKNNQNYEDTKSSKMRDFNLYKSHEAFEEDFSTGKMLLGVFIKMPGSDENLYVCYEEKEKSQFVLEKVKFNDDRVCSKFNLYYAPILFSKKKDSGMFFLFFKGQDEMHKRISGFVIMHPMVTQDQMYQKSNGHTVLTHCWKIRIATGLCDFVPQTLGLCVFVEDE